MEEDKNTETGDVTTTCCRLKVVVRDLQTKIDCEREKQQELTALTNQLYDQIRSIQAEKQTSEEAERKFISQIQCLQEDIIDLEKNKKIAVSQETADILSSHHDDHETDEQNDSTEDAEIRDKMEDDQVEREEYIIEVESVGESTSNAKGTVLVERVHTATPDLQYRDKIIDAVGAEFRVNRDQPAVLDALEALLQLEQINRVNSEPPNINQTISNMVNNECVVTEVDPQEMINTMEVQTSSDYAESPSQVESLSKSDDNASPSPSYSSVCSDVQPTSVHEILQRRVEKACKSAYLPPCRVCSDPATGFHYGVNSCEACKGFFRRSIVKIQQKNQTYKCKRAGSSDRQPCILGPGIRNSCASCRYKKCMATGMAVEAIKTGRYTYEKRTQDTVEVRQLNRKDRKEDEMNEEELDNMLGILRDVQFRNCPEAKLLMDEEVIKQRQQKAYNDYQAKIATFGSLSIVPQDVWNEFFNNTGIDLDNRLQFIKHRLEKMERELTTMVDFVRSIPSFTELTVSDQTALIKASHFEFWYLAAHKCINPTLRVVVGVKDFHESEVKGIVHNGEFTDSIFQVAKSLLTLNLTWEEITILRGIVVTFTDRCDLEEPDKVEKIQTRLLSGLRILAKRNNIEPDKRICKMIEKLTSLRNLSEMSYEINKEILTWPLMKDYPLALDVLQGRT